MFYTRSVTSFLSLGRAIIRSNNRLGVIHKLRHPLSGDMIKHDMGCWMGRIPKFMTSHSKTLYIFKTFEY